MRRALVLLLVAHTAHAAPEDLVARPLVLDAGGFEARLVIEASVALRYYLRPLTFAPDLWVGLTRRLTVGVIHSDQSLDRIDAGSTFCLRWSEVSTCQQLYRGSGLDVRYSALEGHFALAPRLRALLREVDPVKPAITVGALVRWQHGRFAISSDPYLRIGLANQSRGNRTALMVPLWLAVQPAAGWLLWFHTGYASDLAVWRDGWHAPVGIGAQTRLGSRLEVSLETGWDQLAGPQHDYRRVAVILTAGYRQ